MALPSGIARLYRESAPAALVLFLWALPSTDAFGAVDGALLLAGAAMALLYVVNRGLSLAGELAVRPAPEKASEHVRENLHVAGAAAGWLLASVVVSVVADASSHALPAALRSARLLEHVLGAVAFGLAGGGVATVLLYAVAAGVSRRRDEPATDTTG